MSHTYKIPHVRELLMLMDIEVEIIIHNGAENKTMFLDPDRVSFVTLNRDIEDGCGLKVPKDCELSYSVGGEGDMQILTCDDDVNLMMMAGQLASPIHLFVSSAFISNERQNERMLGIDDECLLDNRADVVVEELDTDAEFEPVDEELDEEEIFSDEEVSFSTRERDPRLVVGQDFKDVDAFRLALKHYAIAKRFDATNVKNESNRVTAKCSDVGCPWRIHASRLQDGVTFRIKTLNDEHSCIGKGQDDARMATSYWVSSMIQNWLRHDPKRNANDIIGKIREDHGAEIPYQKAWRAREIAMESINGSHEESYNIIPNYAEALLASNPGSLIKLKRSVDNCFERLFVCFDDCRRGFLSGCRPFLGVDGCHLSGKYHGCLLTAIALDGNNGLFPMAFAVVEIENGEAWQRFFEILKEAIGDIPRLAIMSDGQKGLEGALKRVFPWAEHRLCLQHMFRNYIKKNWGPELESKFWNITKTFAPIPVEKMLKLMEEKTPEVYNWFMRNGEGKCWRRSLYNHDIKCNQYTNNCAESFNSKILDVRHLTIFNLVDGIRQKMMTDLFKRRKLGLTWKDPLVPRVMRYLKKVKEEIRSYRVKKCLKLRAEVTHEENTWAVDIKTRSCSCYDWQISGVPCPHAVAALYDFRLPPEEYVHHFYRVDAYLSCYSFPVNPLLDKSNWPSIVPKSLDPPHERKAPGRPRKKRQRGPDEDRTGRTVQCKRCKGHGHNRKTCKVPLNRIVLESGRATGWVRDPACGRGRGRGRGRAQGQEYGRDHGGSSQEPSSLSTQQWLFWYII